MTPSTQTLLLNRLNHVLSIGIPGLLPGLLAVYVAIQSGIRLIHGENFSGWIIFISLIVVGVGTPYLVTFIEGYLEQLAIGKSVQLAMFSVSSKTANTASSAWAKDPQNPTANELIQALSSPMSDATQAALLKGWQQYNPTPVQWNSWRRFFVPVRHELGDEVEYGATDPLVEPSSISFDPDVTPSFSPDSTIPVVQPIEPLKLAELDQPVLSDPEPVAPPVMVQLEPVIMQAQPELISATQWVGPTPVTLLFTSDVPVVDPNIDHIMPSTPIHTPLIQEEAPQEPKIQDQPQSPSAAPEVAQAPPVASVPAKELKKAPPRKRGL